MKLAFTFLALFVLLVGIVVGQRKIVKTDWEKEDFGQVLSQEDGQLLEEVEEEEKPSEVAEYKTNEKKVSPTPSNTPVPIKVEPKSNLDSYRYPNSTLISSSSSKLLLQSSDNPDVITDWYKAKIQAEDMNVKTFVKTRANDNILNKLVGANSEKEITIEIKRAPGETNVSIEVVLELAS